MLEFLKRWKASRELDLAMRVFLLGWEDLESLLRTKYREEWRGFIDDIVNGAKPYDTALAVVYVLLIDTLRNHLDQSQAKQVAEAIYEKRFEDGPAVFDLISQITYHAYLMEKDATATPGLANAFLTGLAKWFSDNSEEQSAIRDYLLESTIRFRSKSLEAYSANVST